MHGRAIRTMTLMRPGIAGATEVVDATGCKVQVPDHVADVVPAEARAMLTFLAGPQARAVFVRRVFKVE
jgi:hypothetical protein